MIKLELFNGAKTKAAWDRHSPEFIDDWKPESRIIEADHIQFTYATNVSVRQEDFSEAEYVFDEGWLVVDGIYYGDFTVSAV